MKQIEAKIVVLGSQGVGKTSVVTRYVTQTYKHVSPTIGASFFTCKVTIGDYRVKMSVWDTAGQERFRSMAPMYYRKANAAMLVYDISNKDSFDDIKMWVNELKKNIDSYVVLCLLGNKCDLSETEREVKTDEAQEYAASIDALFYETSALSDIGIQDAFMKVGKKLIDLIENRPDLHIEGLEQYNIRQNGELAGNQAEGSVRLEHTTEEKKNCCGR